MSVARFRHGMPYARQVPKMDRVDFTALDLAICRARVVLSIVALFSMYIDPTVGGFLKIDSYALLTVFCYFLYSAAAYAAVRRGIPRRSWLLVTASLDIVFATVLTRFTEAETSPAIAFFLFAIIAAGCWSSLRGTVLVTLACVTMYLVAIAMGSHQARDLYLMRAGYFAIAGYLMIFFGQQRAIMEHRLGELESAAERQNIARSLHDGYIQALAGLNLKLESCRDMLTSEQTSEALAEITELQGRIEREYDEVRAYVRSLANTHPSLSNESFSGFKTQFRVNADFAARGLIVEQVLLIALEGVRNTRRHGHARQAKIEVRQAQSSIRIRIDDDGIGFAESAMPPWTIASRVAEFGGHLTINADGHTGAHLEIEMPDA